MHALLLLALGVPRRRLAQGSSRDEFVKKTHQILARPGCIEGHVVVATSAVCVESAVFFMQL